MIGWTSNYQETLKELGLEDGDVGFPEGPDRGCTVLVGKYIARIRTTLHAWFENILEASSAALYLLFLLHGSPTTVSHVLQGCLTACYAYPCIRHACQHSFDEYALCNGNKLMWGILSGLHTIA